jgi:hypothetical protein
MKKLYYVVIPHFDSSGNLDRFRTINVYSIENYKPKKFAKILCLSDNLGNYFKSDEEEIRWYLVSNGYGDEEFNIIQF